jgi:DNA-binding Lrp family transcriptional regulator
VKTVLKKVGGWTPIIDTLSVDPKYGLQGAAVFGVVWRHCQMRDGVCKASQETLGELIGINSRTTLNKYLKRLVKDGYLIDTTPKIKHKPHIYMDAGKLNMIISLEVEPSEDNEKSGAQEINTSDSDISGDQLGVQGGVQAGAQQMDISITNMTSSTKEKNKTEADATTCFVASQNDAQQRKVNDAANSNHSGLVNKIREALIKDNQQPNDEAIKDAITIWCAECEKMKLDGKEWKLTNIDAILERYDAIVFSTNGLLDRSGTYMRRTFENNE